MQKLDGQGDQWPFTRVIKFDLEFNMLPLHFLGLIELQGCKSN